MLFCFRPTSPQRAASPGRKAGRAAPWPWLGSEWNPPGPPHFSGAEGRGTLPPGAPAAAAPGQPPHRELPVHQLCRGGQRGHPEQLPRGPRDRQPRLRVPVSLHLPQPPPFSCRAGLFREISEGAPCLDPEAVEEGPGLASATPPSLLPSPTISMHHPEALMCSDFVFRARLSGAIIKGYEHDVGTRTSFYGFTAFSLTQSLLILGSRGFPHAPLGQVSKEERVWPPTDFGYGRMQVRQGDGQGDREHSESRACCRYSLQACEGQGRGGQPCQTGGEQAGGLGSKSGHPTEGGTPGPHTVLGPQDVRYLHFLEGTRDYEWLEALLLNRTLTSRNLSWFRYPPPPPLTHRQAVEGAAVKGWTGGDSLSSHLEMGDQSRPRSRFGPPPER